MRFTPTRVGKTADRSAFEMIHRGSPPRVWGRLTPSRRRVDEHWFTPTRVGKTSSRWSMRPTHSVHPHACGEDLPIPMPASARRGSPPRVWGRRCSSVPCRERRRFTPTRVGKTSSPLLDSADRTVHPHACGEDVRRRMMAVLRSGSPPRVWGRHSADWWRRDGGRFTPTRVGKTSSSRSRAPRTAVHPHACGEDIVAHKSNPRGVGSPPRVWGRRVIGSGIPTSLRFTPTRVGKTGPTVGQTVRP